MNRVVVVIQSSGSGVVIHVRVATRAGRAGIAGTRDGHLVVRLHAAPVENAANDELIERLAEILRVPKRAVSIVSGTRSRNKRVGVADLDVATAAARLGVPGKSEPA